MATLAQVATATFSDGSTLQFDGDDFVVLVGPNNSGKSASLRDIRDLASGSGGNRLAVRDVTYRKEGTPEELWDLIRRVGTYNWDASTAGHEVYWLEGNSVAQDAAQTYTHQPNLWVLRPVFLAYLDAGGRLNVSATQGAIDFGRQPKTHPMHFLHQSAPLQEKLSSLFRRAFGTEIAVDMKAGSVIPLHVGPGASRTPGEGPLDDPYIDRLRRLPRLDVQGDGMRSFVGVTLYALMSHFSMLLIDEPEAFLHPPQARQLGNLLGRERRKDVQLFTATHSADFLRGALESNHSRLRVIRIRREGSVNRVKELKSESIKHVWADPVLRYSSILEGVFHEKVVVCEADGDCRFYGAMADALREADDHPYIRDVMFAQAGGKGGIPKLTSALVELDVPVAAVTDFDLFRDAGQLWAIVESLRGDPAVFKEDYSKVKESVEALGAFTVAAAKKRVIDILNETSDEAEKFPSSVRGRVSKALGTPPGWVIAKNSGIEAMPHGDVRTAADRLLSELAKIGLHIVPKGELESFEPELPFDKNDWVAAVLEKYSGKLATAEELAAARRFVETIISRQGGAPALPEGQAPSA